MKDLEEYLQQAEPHKREKATYWRTAIGLQKVDGLENSAYLIETAKKHIDGDITLDEVKSLLNSYYRSRESRREVETDDRTKEADLVAAHITEILSEHTLTFSPAGFAAIHKRLFTGVFAHAGRYRDYNITKKEWVLNGASVTYVSASELQMALDYDFQREKSFKYVGLTAEETIQHLARFIAGIWQIHPFCEGNTRTTAIFFIQYLRKLGFKVHNEPFEEHAWYFRNALVRASYSCIRESIDEWYEPLEYFLKNLLMHENHSLQNRFLLIGEQGERLRARLRDIENGQNDIENGQNDIENGQDDIENGQDDIENGQDDIENSRDDIENGQDDIENGQDDIENSRDDIENGQNDIENSQNDLPSLILCLISGNSKITIAEMSARLCKSQSTIARHIRTLKTEGKIERVGPDKGGYWKLGILN